MILWDGLFLKNMPHAIAKKDNLHLLTIMIERGWNLTEHSPQMLREGLKEYQQCHMKRTRTVQNNTSIEEPIEAYLARVKMSHPDARVNPFIDFALHLIAFIPTTVGCESTFSRHNNNIREDRKSMDRETSNAYIQLSTRMLDIKNFDYDQVSHLLPHIIFSGSNQTQAPHIENARKASQKAYKHRALGI